MILSVSQAGLIQTYKKHGLQPIIIEDNYIPENNYIVNIMILNIN